MDNAWTYEAGGASAVEMAMWAGDTPPDIRLHFHDSDQITIVLSGRRAFLCAGQRIEVEAGSCLVIPAGFPHQSLPEYRPGTRCINFYQPADPKLTAPVIRNALASSPDSNRRVQLPILSSALPDLPDGLVARIAATSGMSREGFTRRHTKQFGMSPHARRLMMRLNRARAMLRQGGKLADVAADLGFADQSHLGRQFRAAFGVTPGAYRASFLQSQTFYT